MSASLPRGMVGLLGPNGAGKSTLIKVIAGALSADQGTVLYGDEPTAGRVGYVPQHRALIMHMSARDFVAYAGWLKGMSSRAARCHADECLKQVRLEHRADSRMSQLSGGMQRRVSIAAALSGDPPLLLLDEPTTGLDMEERDEFQSLLTRIACDKDILLSSHLAEDLVRTCPYVVVLEQGQVRFTGEMTVLCDGEPTTEKLLLGYRSVLKSAQER
ncbi:ATP-binding cassette domain-containing protein [Austwickia sp. TVS 96-490-7B]|uniref:ATP-binding cassette domain-containing protein n=1 Tax=Austwickia sp. TVS 96-490-7B TaxID=2830843 RepID=UPI001C58A2EB|nr:ATP-binding cassette domain-containing protein [Austwickia sp. TVS 96-490-7B]